MLQGKTGVIWAMSDVSFYFMFLGLPMVPIRNFSVNYSYGSDKKSEWPEIGMSSN